MMDIFLLTRILQNQTGSSYSFLLITNIPLRSHSLAFNVGSSQPMAVVAAGEAALPRTVSWSMESRCWYFCTCEVIFIERGWFSRRGQTHLALFDA